MSARASRRRGVVLLVLALACGALAASEVGDRVSDVEGRIGVPVPVVVAARDVEPGAELTRADLRISHVPQRFAPPDAPTSPDQAVGLHTSGPVAAGSPITAGVVGATASGDDPGALRRTERAVEVTVAGGASLIETAVPGDRVDVVVSTDPGDGPGSSFVALEDVELPRWRPERPPRLRSMPTSRRVRRLQRSRRSGRPCAKPSISPPPRATPARSGSYPVRPATVVVSAVPRLALTTSRETRRRLVLAFDWCLCDGPRVIRSVRSG